MEHPFSDCTIAFNDLKKTLHELAKQVDSPFDKSFPDRLPNITAYDFDSISKSVCSYRSSASKRLLHSADALLVLQADTFLLVNT